MQRATSWPGTSTLRENKHRCSTNALKPTPPLIHCRGSQPGSEGSSFLVTTTFPTLFRFGFERKQNGRHNRENGSRSLRQRHVLMDQQHRQHDRHQRIQRDQ